MAAPIATTRRLIDLGDIAEREGLTRRDPWASAPDFPDATAWVWTLRLDGDLKREHVDDVVDWSMIAAYRFEDSFGLELTLNRSSWYDY